MFLMLAAMLADPSAHSGVKYSLGNVNESSIPYVVAYTECFERAWMANINADKQPRDEALGACMTMRPTLIEKYGSSRTGDRLQAKRNLERSFDGIEKAYQKASDKKG
jgi:hypothetical protein